MKLAAKLFFGFTVIALALNIFGYRVLVHEHLAKVGETYSVEGYGELTTAKQSQLSCTYFTGRSFKTVVLWYSPDNFMGRDSCPFISRPM
jgi:hypothetical protein